MMTKRMIEHSETVNLDELSPEDVIKVLTSFVGLNATIKIEYYEGTTVDINWEVEETDEELNARIKYEASEAGIYKEMRRANYEKLKLEFGN